MSAVPWSDAVAEADLHIDADLPTGAMATTSTRVSYSDAARDPAVESSSLPDDDLNVIDERTAALLGRRPPLHRSTFERDNFSFDNTLPDRPRTAYFFLGDTDISTDDIFSEIGTHGILPADVKCLQRNPAGHTYITFTSDHLRNVFLKNSAFVSRRRASNYNLLPGARRVYVAVLTRPMSFLMRPLHTVWHLMARLNLIVAHLFKTVLMFTMVIAPFIFAAFKNIFLLLCASVNFLSVLNILVSTLLAVNAISMITKLKTVLTLFVIIVMTLATLVKIALILKNV